MAPQRYHVPVQLAARAVGLPMPEREYRFAPPRRWRFDFSYPQWHVAIEVQGAIWTQGRHSRGSGLLLEHEKLNAAASLGWRVLYTTPKDCGNLAFWRTVKAAADYPNGDHP